MGFSVSTNFVPDADPPVGGLARESGGSASMLNVPPPSRASLNWSSKSGHRLRCLCRFLLHRYWRQVFVVAVEPGAVVVHEEAHHIGLCFFGRAVAAARDPF